MLANVWDKILIVNTIESKSNVIQRVVMIPEIKKSVVYIKSQFIIESIKIDNRTPMCKYTTVNDKY